VSVDLNKKIEEICAAQAWTAAWVRRGMICVMDLSRPKGKQSFELKGTALPTRFDAIGCGGWDEDGTLHWVGLDLDVGHGHEKNAYESTEAAVAAALTVFEFTGGAAEIRLSKSGVGVHVRVAVKLPELPTPHPSPLPQGERGPERHGRKQAPLIAKWLAKTLEIKSDTAVLGRQNLWFWAAQPGARGFELVTGKSVPAWSVPPAALKEPEVIAPAAPAMPIPTAGRRDAGGPSVVERASKYLDKVPGAVSGSGGHNHTFHVACALIQGFALSVDEARPLFYSWNTRCSPPWSEKELEHKLAQAAKAKVDPQHPIGYLRDAKDPDYKPARPVCEPGGAETVIELPDLTPGPFPGREGETDAAAAEKGAISSAGQHENSRATPTPPQTGAAGDRVQGSGSEPDLDRRPPADSAAVYVDRSGRIQGELFAPPKPQLPSGEAGKWLDEQLPEALRGAKYATGTARDKAVIALFDKLAEHLPGASAVTTERVKKDVMKELDMLSRPYDKALAEARRARQGKLAGGEDADGAELAREYLRWLREGDDDPERPRGPGDLPRRVLRFWREDWYEWTPENGCYRIQSDNWIKHQAGLWLAARGLALTTKNMGNFILALKVLTTLHDEIKPPAWLANEPGAAEPEMAA